MRRHLLAALAAIVALSAGPAFAGGSCIDPDGCFAKLTLWTWVAALFG